MMKNKNMAPIASVKESYQTKEKLVEKLISVLKKDEKESKDEFKKRLLKVSNKKLLNLERRSGTTSS
jgi:thioredoxin-like negative regulator of GroEL